MAALYDLEPTIRDVFVEGANDRGVLQWYLAARDRRHVSVVEIDSVDVPESLVENHGLDIGNRGCVIALAYELEHRLNQEARSAVTLVVDADCDRVNKVNLDCSILVSTDFSCFEMYWFNERVIEKFGHLAGVPGLPAAKTVLNELAKVLQPLFVIRLSNHTLKLEMSWMSFDKVCERREEAIVFDKDEFVRRYLMNNSQLPRSEEFHTEIARIETRLLPDPRHQMHGHDFLTLFYWYVHPLVSGKKGFSGEEALARTLRTCLELEQLDDQPMFQTILRRVDGAQP